MTVTRFLIAANILVFALQQFMGQVLIVKFALWPIGDFFASDVQGPIGFRPWQLVTSAFLHGGVAHLVLNMFALFMFGKEIERALGSTRFAALYGASVLTASLTQLLVVTATGGVYPTLGASGGVFGVLLAFGVLFPNQMVVLLFPPIPMRAKYFVALYGIVELFQGVLGTQAGVAHFAHLGGMLGAGIVLLAWRRRR
jgi:membrane associated rhomboid family serine protease